MESEQPRPELLMLRRKAIRVQGTKPEECTTAGNDYITAMYHYVELATTPPLIQREQAAAFLLLSPSLASFL
jgi:hypothetical protein